MRSLKTINCLTEAEIFSLIKRAINLKKGAIPKKKPGLFVGNLFFENSTRTKISFEVAQRKLALESINFEVQNSSINKGESLYDTCKTLEMLGLKIIVIRHSKEVFWEELGDLQIPLINAGDGSGSHPTQSLLDLMTIYEYFGSFKGLKIAIVGDIRNSRVSASNLQALKRLGAEVFLVAPEHLKRDHDSEYFLLDDVIDKVDILMLLRIQFERHGQEDTKKLYSDYHKNYGLTKERYKLLKKGSIIMHPAPVNRNVEIASELVESEKSLIFQQMENGVFMRQAILEFIIEENQL